MNVKTEKVAARTLALVLVLAFLLTGCASPSASWRQAAGAAVGAAKDPGTWAPLAVAVVVKATGDERWTRDAYRRTPAFGGQDAACESSDDAVLALDLLWLATAVRADLDDQDRPSAVLVGVLVHDASIVTTNAVKRSVHEREPDPDIKAPEHQSFPSNHSTPAFTQAALVRRNLWRTGWSEDTRRGLTATAYALSAMSAYGRIEGGLHRYSDQFAGAALGNFVGLFLHDALVGEASQTSVSIIPSSRGVMAVVSMPF